MSGKKSKKTHDSGIFRHFEDLKTLLENKSVRLSSMPPEAFFEPVRNLPDISDETELFLAAVSDVMPIASKTRIIQKTARPAFHEKIPAESETLRELNRLITKGEGFVVADTPEYMEGIGVDIFPEMARRLHRGEFSIQGHLDLHGMGVQDAQEAFEKFIGEAITSGKRTILIVHGRGLSSPSEPVLKTKVREWLTTGAYRKWVIAFTSARSCDGGTGATYILLRKHPAKKRRRKYQII